MCCCVYFQTVSPLYGVTVCERSKICKDDAEEMLQSTISAYQMRTKKEQMNKHAHGKHYII